VLLILRSEVLPETLVPMEEMQTALKTHPRQYAAQVPEPSKRERPVSVVNYSWF